jgi:cell division septum initiation protein DivIVA
MTPYQMIADLAASVDQLIRANAQQQQTVADLRAKLEAAETELATLRTMVAPAND